MSTFVVCFIVVLKAACQLSAFSGCNKSIVPFLNGHFWYDDQLHWFVKADLFLLARCFVSDCDYVFYWNRLWSIGFSVLARWSCVPNRIRHESMWKLRNSCGPEVQGRSGTGYGKDHNFQIVFASHPAENSKRRRTYRNGFLGSRSRRLPIMQYSPRRGFGLSSATRNADTTRVPCKSSISICSRIHALRCFETIWRDNIFVLIP